MERHTEIVRQWRLLLALEGRARALTLTSCSRRPEKAYRTAPSAGT